MKNFMGNLQPRNRSKPLKIRCKRLVRIHGGALHGHAQVSVAVPIIADGQGEVSLEPRSSFGCREAPSCGDGHIRLQARIAKARIRIGSGFAFSNNISICALDLISIGDRCLIGDMVTIMDADHHEIDPKQRWNGQGRIAPVNIGDNVWIGSRALILQGVTIGENSVIGAGSVVTKSIPANSVAGGNPARLIRNI
jgi:acetyltransferase-like isoleucine patch superfamily enzyme